MGGEKSVLDHSVLCSVEVMKSRICTFMPPEFSWSGTYLNTRTILKFYCVLCCNYWCFTVVHVFTYHCCFLNTGRAEIAKWIREEFMVVTLGYKYICEDERIVWTGRFRTGTGIMWLFVNWRHSSDRLCTRVGTLIVATIYLQLIHNSYMFRSFIVLQCSHQHCVQPVASDVEVVGYL